jgi:purine-binding chemotaxis protein CheW
MVKDFMTQLDDLSGYEDIDQQLSLSGTGQQFVTFYIKDEKYALDIKSIREFITFSQITQMPNLPAYVKGIINLRGNIIPVVDLRARFNLEELVYNKYTVIIIVQVESKHVGMVVDAVSDVIFLSEDHIQPPPDFATNIDMDFITGMGQHNDELVILVDGEKLLSPKELLMLSSENDTKNFTNTVQEKL